MLVGLFKKRFAYIAVAAVLLYVGSMPIVSKALFRQIESGEVKLTPQDVPQADAIVVLGGMLTWVPSKQGLVTEWGDPDRFFGHGYTYSGHPVCCAASLKALEIVERENLMGNVHDVGSYFERRLHELEDLPIVGNVRGRKLMMCVEFVADRQTKQTLPDAVNVGKLVSNHCEKLGLIVRSIVHLNIMSPAFVLTRDNVDFVVDTLRQGIVSTMGELKAMGVTYGH